MPRYFFHLSGLIDYEDSLGTMLADDDEARSVALLSTGELLLDHQGPAPVSWDLAVRAVNEMGREVASVTLRGETPAVQQTFRLHGSTAGGRL